MTKFALLLYSLLSAQAAFAACNIPNTNLDFEVFERAIRNRDCNIKSIDNVLELLPEAMRTDPVLMYRSESLQDPHKTDYQHPRAILKSARGARQLFVTYNGDQKQKGFKNLEVASVNLREPAPSPDIIRYYDFEFPTDTDAEKLSWDEAQSRIKISGPNPAKCLSCHGNPARPIFAGYPIWTGSYGSFHLSVDETEEREFKTFTANLQSRYRHLRFSADTSARTPDSYLRGEINFQLNGDLAVANAHRVARIVQQTKDFDSYKYAFVGASLACSDFIGFIPERIQAALNSVIDRKMQSSPAAKNPAPVFKGIFREGPNQFTGANFSDATLINSTYNAADWTVENIVQIAKRWAPTATLFRLFSDTLEHQGRQRSTPQALYWRYLMEGREIDISNWFMDLRKPGYRLLSGNSSGDLAGWAVINDDPAFSFVHSKWNPANGNGGATLDYTKIPALCEELKRLSVSALDRLTLSEPSGAKQSIVSAYPTAFKNVCIQCHSGSNVAPRIPFADPNEMREWLKAAGNRRLLRKRIFGPKDQRMPPNGELSESEQSEIKRYLGRSSR